MAEGFLYLDLSALVKLVLPEPETVALLDFLAEWEEHVSSVLAAIEVPRAAARASTSPLIHRRAKQVVENVHLVTIDDEVLEIAADLGPSGLRTLDTIHLASALVLEPDLGALVSYDARLNEAAAQSDVRVLAPR